MVSIATDTTNVKPAEQGAWVGTPDDRKIQLDGIRYWLNFETGVQKMGFCTFSDSTV